MKTKLILTLSAFVIGFGTIAFAFNYDKEEVQLKSELKKLDYTIQDNEFTINTLSGAITQKEKELEKLIEDKYFYEMILEDDKSKRLKIIERLGLKKEEIKEIKETGFFTSLNTLFVCGHGVNENNGYKDVGAIYGNAPERSLILSTAATLQDKGYNLLGCDEDLSIEAKAEAIKNLEYAHYDYIIELHFDVRPEGDDVTRGTKLIYKNEQEAVDNLCSEIGTCKTWYKDNMKFTNLVPNGIIAEIADPNQEDFDIYLNNFINAF